MRTASEMRDQLRLKNARWGLNESRQPLAVLGQTTEQVKYSVEQLLKDPRKRAILEVSFQGFLVRNNQLDPERLRSLAKTLLHHGADPNADHQYPNPGFTPFLLAIELDEVEIVQTMLDTGCNLHQDVRIPTIPHINTPLNLAITYGSHKCKALLESRQSA